MDCIAPCPTGSIDNWRVVATPYTLEEQLPGWSCRRRRMIGARRRRQRDRSAGRGESARLLAEAHQGAGGRAKAPASASKPSVNLYTAAQPAQRHRAGQLPADGRGMPTATSAISSSISATRTFPVLEGQSVGIVAPGTDANGTAASAAALFRIQPARRRAAEHQQSLADRQAGAAGASVPTMSAISQGRQVAPDRPVRRRPS